MARRTFPKKPKKNHKRSGKFSETRIAITIVSIVFFMVWGGVSTAFVFVDIHYYFNAALFFCSFGMAGLVIGWIIAKKAKPLIAIDANLQSNYGKLKILVCIGFMGSTLFLAERINKCNPAFEMCGSYPVEGKVYSPPGFKKKEVHKIVVNFKGEDHYIRIRKNYWSRLSNRSVVNVCFYTGLLGFQYYLLPDNK